MGEETRKVVDKLDNVIRGMAKSVAIIETKQEATYGTVGRIEAQVNKINSRVDSLESTRDEDIGKSKRSAAIKKSVAWGLGITGSVVGLLFIGFRIWG